jgi:hypothetical protein
MGGLGDFDEHGVFPFHIFELDNQVLAYTTGLSRRKSVSIDSSIGLAISQDGGHIFKRFGRGPVLTSSLHEPFLICDGFVRKIRNVLHMWYVSGLRWIDNPDGGEPERVYKIVHAVSNDGIKWEKENRLIIPDYIGEDECQALPTVIEVDGVCHMVFCYRDAIGFRNEAGKGYRLGYAYSKDLVNWTRDDQVLGLELTGEGWDGQMMCYPHLFRLNGRIALLYNGNNFGKEGFGLAILESDMNEHIKL